MEAYEIDAISLLPEEVWKYILDFAVANDEETLDSCKLTCRLWEKLSRQHNFRLKFHHVLPHFYRYLSGSDILNCRFTCKKWCITGNGYSPVSKPKLSYTINEVGIRGNTRIDQVYEAEIDSLHFIFRSIAITIGPSVNIHREITPHLTKVGTFVRALHVKFPVQQMVHVFAHLVQILARLRGSLEYLKLSTIPVGTMDEIIQMELTNVRLPSLIKLKQLNVTELPDVLQRIFIDRYKSQIEAKNHVAIDTCQVIMNREQPGEFMWKGPTDLLHTSVGNRFLIRAHFSIFKKNFSIFPNCVRTPNYGQTLETLSLKFDFGKKKYENILGNKDLIKPSIAQQSSGYVPSSFEFLKDLRNLRKLKIKLGRETYMRFLQSKENLDGTKNIIDFIKNLEKLEDLEDDDIVFRKLYKSNIWSLLKKLKSVCFVIVKDSQSEGGCQVTRVYTKRELNELYL